MYIRLWICFANKVGNHEGKCTERRYYGCLHDDTQDAEIAHFADTSQRADDEFDEKIHEISYTDR